MLVLKHRYYYFHSISNKSLCECTKRIINEFSTFYLKVLFTCNFGLTIYKIHELVNSFFSTMNIYKILDIWNRGRRWLKPQQWQYWKMMKIIPFIFVDKYFILFSKFYHFLFVCFYCAYDRIDDFDRELFG